MIVVPERAALVRASLQRLADGHGDVTPQVLERYYRAMPEARASFEHHGLNDVPGLEARMVAESLFLLLQWAEDRPSALIDQGITVVHHNDALGIGPRWYMGLIDAVVETALATIPSEVADERAAWREMRDEIARFIDSLRPEFVRALDDDPLAS